MNDTFYKKYPPFISVDNEEGLVFANLIFWNGALSAGYNNFK